MVSHMQSKILWQDCIDSIFHLAILSYRDNSYTTVSLIDHIGTIARQLLVVGMLLS